MQSFYVDTCIYLNLWKKEEDKAGIPLWFFAQKFFEFVEANNHKLYYSGFVLKELLFNLSPEEYLERREYFDKNKIFRKIEMTKEERDKGISLKGKIKTTCSLYDILNILLAKKSNSVLVTQDKELIKLAKFLGIEAKTPQEAISY